MDVNLIGLIGNIVRLIFVFQFSFKKQNTASEKSFETEEKKDIIAGSIVIVLIIILGLLTYGIK